MMNEATIDIKDSLLISENDDVEIWVPTELAKQIGKRLIDLNEIFGYSPVPGDPDIVNIDTGTEQLAKVIEIKVKVKLKE